MTKPTPPNQKLDIEKILEGLESYHPPRKGWTWRDVPEGGVDMGPFHFRDMSKPLERSIGLPASKYFDHIDPQPSCVVTTEIASGRFEDDIRRMRMAAWHGADHIMVIRTTGQSHIDGLLEGTPEGIGGVPITRKQIRASRKACDEIEKEVGRPINFHSYVSGVAGPEVAVLFAEEGINGAHQDPQYNVLYRNVNMYRSFVDAAEAKKVMAGARIFQIDGAHNANATAKAGWLVMPELMVQHGLNCAFSVAVGMDKDLIGLSTVPPNSPPAPKLWYDLPYAVALRDFFSDFKMRAQQNTRYIEADIEEAVRTHTVDTLISMLTRADIQSTITPDEGRNVPWHYNNIRGVQTVKQTWAALDGIKELVSLNHDGPLGEMVRDLKERAVAFLEEVLEVGGYFAAVEKGFFVDSAKYPERSGDGIARDGNGGVGAGSLVVRDADYLAPVCDHFGTNHVPVDAEKPCDPIDGCTLCDPGEDRLHRRARPRGQLQPAPREDASLPEGKCNQARGRVGGRRDGPRPALRPRERGDRPRLRRRDGEEDGPRRPGGHQHDGPPPGGRVLRRGEGEGRVRHRPDDAEDPREGSDPPRAGAARRREGRRPEGRRRDRRRGRAQRRPARDPRHQARRHREVRREVPLPRHVGAHRQARRRRHRDRARTPS